MRTRAAIYARYSTDRQDARSIDDQLRRCRRYAAEHQHQVVVEYSDAAQSGATLDREGMRRMLAAAAARPRAFDAVLVDDLSRLSRDLGGFWNIVFGDLAAAGVRVVDCTTGRASNERGARLTFGVTALMSDAFLETVKAETHRGLEGRALAGFHTGGRCFGYRTTPEPDPVDPEHPRAVLRVEPDEARLVRRVFERYVAGEGAATIAASLNREGVLAPYDRLGYEKRAGRGWATNQVQALLRNERYVGRIVWNKREFYRDPTTRKRRARLRPEADWVVTEAPELAIVPREVWDAAQERHRARRPGGQVNGKRTVRLLSGFLRCGTCSSAMAIVAATTKRGVTYARYGCSAHHGKGDAACRNARMVSERKVNEMVLQGLEAYLQSPDFEAWVQEDVAAADRARGRQRDAASDELETELRAQQAKVERVTAAILEVGVSEALRAALVREEARLRELRAKATAARAPKVVRLALDLAQAAGAVREIARLADEDATRARARLAPYLDHVVMVPGERPGEYQAEVVLVGNATAALAGGRPVPSVVDGLGCGGPIAGPSTTPNPSFPGKIAG